MESGLRYRGYVIYSDGHEFVAEPDEKVPTPDFIEYPIFEMGNRSVDRLIRAIDELWDAVNGVSAMPAWYEAWMNAGVDGRIALPRDVDTDLIIVRADEIRVENVKAKVKKPKNFEVKGVGASLKNTLPVLVAKEDIAKAKKSGWNLRELIRDTREGGVTADRLFKIGFIGLSGGAAAVSGIGPGIIAVGLASGLVFGADRLGRAT